jgi:hypothetical protein
MLDIHEYERNEYERGLLETIARGEKDVRENKLLDFDEVMNEAEKLLDE